MRVLIAEDDANIRAGLVEILEREGYEVIEAPDGKAALVRFEADRPDFICLDIMMPDTNGYDVCRKIREADPDVPIVFISAKSEEVDKVLGLELGADDYILKPFSPVELSARVWRLLRRGRAASAV